MLATLIIWLYMFCLSFSVGLFLYKFISRYADDEHQANPPEAVLLSLIGLLAITVYLSIVSLFFPVNHKVHLPVVIMIAFALASDTRFFWAYLQAYTRAVEIKSVLFFFVFAALLLIQSLKYPFVTDTGLYHAQTIQWFEKFKVVPGLGNLHGRLAFNSHFHLLTAAFNFSAYGHDMYGAVNGFIILMLLALFSKKIILYFSSFPEVSVFCTGSVLITFIYYRDWISSPTPDIPATVYLLLVFFLLLEVTLIEKEKALYWRSLVILFTSICLLTIKLSVFPVALVVAYLAFTRRKSIRSRHIYFTLGIGLIIMLPWFIRNVVLSGYLIYPLPSIDLFSFDWKIPVEKVRVEKEWIRSFARMASYDWVRVSKLSFVEWFPAWFQRQWWIDKVIFVVASISPLLVAISYLIRNQISSAKLLPVWLITWLCLVAWFLMSPAFRFGHGFIVACLLLTSLVLAPVRLSGVFFYLLYTLCLLFGVHSVIKEGREIDSLAEVMIFPEKYSRVSIRSARLKSGNKINIPIVNELCWDEPIPCTPYPNPELRMRGIGLQFGFRVKKTD